MAEKTKKKRIVLRVLLILLIVLLAAIVIPIAQLYVQYRKISYAPSTPVERSDEYVLPDYPEVIPGSEVTSDLPDVPETTEPIATSEAPENVTITVTTEAPPTEAVTTPAQTETTTEPQVTDTPETLPSITYDPPETDPPITGAPSADTTPAVTYPPPVYNEENSFSNSNPLSVYGQTPIYKVQQKDPNIMNILVLGTDSRDVVIDRGRSDLMLVVSYNQKTGEIRMLSLLRDLLVPLEGYEWNRINTAYFFDGAGLAVNTVNQLFGLDIQHFVVVDFNGLKDFIDHIGGIELTLSEAEANFLGIPYSTEPVHLDGAATLLHARNRAIDNDFRRTERQRKVIVAVCNKMIAEKSISEISDATQYAMRMIKTNIPASKLVSLAVNVLGNGKSLSIQQQSVPYNDAYQFVWYKGMAVISFDIQTTGSRMREFLYK